MLSASLIVGHGGNCSGGASATISVSMRRDKVAISDRLTIDHLSIVSQRSKFADPAVDFFKLLRFNQAAQLHQSPKQAPPCLMIEPAFFHRPINAAAFAY